MKSVWMCMCLEHFYNNNNNVQEIGRHALTNTSLEFFGDKFNYYKCSCVWLSCEN